MSYRAYHDYDDDRDIITCVTLSDTRPVARKPCHPLLKEIRALDAHMRQIGRRQSGTRTQLRLGDV